MDFESEGIRHVSIQKHKDTEYSENNARLEKENFIDGDSDHVNLDSLLKAVIDISDRLHDQEEKIKQHQDEQQKRDDENNYNDRMRHGQNKTCVKSRPRTAVMKYNRQNSSSSDSDIGNEASTFSSSMSMRSSSSRARFKNRPSSSQSVADSNSAKLSMSFSNNQVRDIDIENQRLLREILRKKCQTPTQKKPAGPVRVRSAASINRSRKQQDIERENLRLLNRLQAVKPTNGLSRDKLMFDHIKNEKHVDRLSKSSKRRPVSAPVSRVRPQYVNSKTRSYDSESLADSRISSASTKRTSGRTSSARVRAPRKIKVEETWEPGW
ncbi:cilia- and flagella-associated protein 97-like [Hydractinia symbiolongicarpus]|uniref:cilia- and flagella-associated protein 97-like n=1 Tax=Hydractinia symbiolongicarpus TaxID=13093 RepID=UPI00254A6E0B|nr:cilia- and flagella-associated protein 97-like [Hydractinia symbiolongicarpus]